MGEAVLPNLALFWGWYKQLRKLALHVWSLRRKNKCVVLHPLELPQHAFCLPSRIHNNFVNHLYCLTNSRLDFVHCLASFLAHVMNVTHRTCVFRAFSLRRER